MGQSEVLEVLWQKRMTSQGNISKSSYFSVDEILLMLPEPPTRNNILISIKKLQRMGYLEQAIGLNFINKYRLNSKYATTDFFNKSLSEFELGSISLIKQGDGINE